MDLLGRVFAVTGHLATASRFGPVAPHFGQTP